ncbi:MFS transporter [Jiangella muralis]|uniref:MFS transporter n=1 Tax=Jiangella muralis TaxID=702383 RepID=UPI0009FB3DC0|nr:MFS transporter [Jiangella muralis]
MAIDEHDDARPGRVPGDRVAAEAATARRRAYTLAIVVTAQFLIVLDASVVNIALPSAQADLGLADSRKQWVVTGYSLAFGGLLLLGGRVADVRGRQKTFVAGLIGFTLASVLGGLAVNEAMLLAARAAQGASAAFLAPAGLAILTTAYTDGAGRAKAFAIFGVTSGAGGILGMVLGGVLTSFGSWRWCLLINLPVGLVILVLALRHLEESTAARPTRYDLPGAVTATAGVGSFIYGVSNVAADGWFAPTTLAFILGGVALLTLFVALQRRSSEPMMPLGILAHRTRGGAFLIILLVNAVASTFYLLLTFYLQGVQDLSALLTGLAFVPIGVGIFVGAVAAGRLLPVWPARNVIAVGLALAVCGMAPMAWLRADSSFWSLILPAQVVLGVGFGIALTAIVSLALQGVAPATAGVASALTNAVREIGGAVGISVLNVVAIAVTAASIDPNPAEASADGYAAAFAVCAGLLAAALAVAVTSLRPEPATPGGRGAT